MLVHGGFVDGSGWQGIYDLLKADGYASRRPEPNPVLAGDVAATRLIIDAQDGPVVLVGHSYGGAVIPEAAPRTWQHWSTSRRSYPTGKSRSTRSSPVSRRRAAAADPAAPGRFLFLDRDKFPASFAGDLPAEEAAFMADSQVPWA